MMIGGLGDTNVHIISRVGGSGTEWRLREFLRSSGFMARTGFLADNVHFCRHRSGMYGKGVFCSDTSTSPTLWTITRSASWTSALRCKGRQCFF